MIHTKHTTVLQFGTLFVRLMGRSSTVCYSITDREAAKRGFLSLQNARPFSWDGPISTIMRWPYTGDLIDVARARSETGAGLFPFAVTATCRGSRTMAFGRPSDVFRRLETESISSRQKPREVLSRQFRRCMPAEEKCFLHSVVTFSPRLLTLSTRQQLCGVVA